MIGFGSALRDGLFSFISLITFAVLIFEIVALVDAAVRREDAYRAADKMTKQGWLILLAISVGASMFLGLFFTIIGIIVAIVYWVDVRPALKQVSGRAKDNRPQGPYGPW